MKQRSQRPTTSQKLKKQPKLQRVNAMSTVAQPRLAIPKTTQRAAQRRRRSRRRIKFAFPTAFFKRVLTSSRWVSLALLIIVVYTLLTIGSNQNFYLTRIPVEGVYSIPAEEIVAASTLAGQHIFAVDPAKAAAQITETPGIIAASVEVSWPNHVLISITEDTPIAIWEDPDGTFWINSEGHLIPARLDVPGLYRIQANTVTAVLGRQYAAEEETASLEEASMVNTETTAAEGETVAQTGPMIQELGSVPAPILAAALQLNELLPDRPMIHYDSRHGLTYRDSRGWDVYLGTGTDMKQKLAVYDAIVTELQAQGLTPEYISVSNQEKPYFFAYESTE